MIEEHLIARGIKDDSVLAAFRDIPRERFVPHDKKHYAYSDHPLPIGFGQTISQPFIVALMTQVLQIEKNDRVLEVGTGSFGYQLSWYQRAGFRVFAIERDFFLENYPEPIYECGIQLKDMLRLALEYEPQH